MFNRRVTSSSVFFALVSTVALAQPAPQPTFQAPPEVEQALRARVTEFYQLHVESNFQKAWSLVAEDTKAYYFGAQKNTFESFRITGVRFTNKECTKAMVDLETRQKMLRREFQGVIVPTPATTLWKIEDGKWVWYRDPEDNHLTPMGTSDLSKVNPAGGDKAKAEQLAQLTSPEEIQRRARDILKQSGVDKQEVMLAADKPSSAEVTFHNGQQGTIKLMLDPGAELAGFAATLDKVDVGPSQDAVVKISYAPPSGSGAKPQPMPQERQVRLILQPFNQVFAIKVKFGGPAAANH
jgi:hypothetical protein